MITLRRGQVVEVLPGWPGVQVLLVSLPDAAPLRAINYVTLFGSAQVGELVEINTNALERGLGTGGFGLLTSRLQPDAEVDGSPAGEPALDAQPRSAEAPGHLVKARYTPLQTMVLGADEQDSEHHELLRDADDLAGLPVVVADLHSALPAVIAGARWAASEAGRAAPRVVYVMSDGGALPLWFSRTVAQLRDADWLAGTVTAGQAFGGDWECVNVHSALLTAHLVAQADLVVVAQGPGNLGTGTRWGFSGTAAGEAVNAAGVLGGRPVAALRMSQADLRERHVGISHHSLTAFGRVALVPADCVLPKLPGAVLSSRVPASVLGLAAHQAQFLVEKGHNVVELGVPDGLWADLEASPAALRTMGRSLEQDPLSFLASAAAGVHAMHLVTDN